MITRLKEIAAKAQTQVEPLVEKLLVLIVITIVVSVTSFRLFWSNDVFHTAFVGMLLYKPVLKFCKNILD